MTFSRLALGFDPHWAKDTQKFEDRYESALKGLIERKQAGKKIEPAKHAASPKVVNLLEALRASVEADKKKPAAASVRARKPAKEKASR